jgi:hypothetical protein
MTRWTPEEDAIAKALVATGGSSSSLNGKMEGRSGAAIRSRVNYLAMTKEQRFRANLRRRNGRVAPPRVRQRVHVSTFEPPPEVLEEAMLCANSPRTPAMLLFGDPLPGRSALDQRGRA